VGTCIPRVHLTSYAHAYNVSEYIMKRSVSNSHDAASVYSSVTPYAGNLTCFLTIGAHGIFFLWVDESKHLEFSSPTGGPPGAELPWKSEAEAPEADGML